MKKAYIILAHKDEAQVKRLVDTLDDLNSTFYLHVDLNSAIHNFKMMFGRDRRVVFVKRVRAGWGTFGLVEATLNAMRCIKLQGQVDKVILLSGQDYPIKSNEEIDHYFKNSPYHIFMDYFSLPNYSKWGSNGGMYRVNKYFFGPSVFEKYSARAINFLAIFFPFLKRSYTSGMQPFSGSQWWAMNMRALKYILNYVDSNPEYIKFHKNTFAADELFFQMILLNSSDDLIKRNITNNNLRYMKWASPSAAHPEVLRLKDLEQIGSSHALFARKFDPKVDPQVIDVIDNEFLNGLAGAV